jgi:hypothetical protein
MENDELETTNPEEDPLGDELTDGYDELGDEPLVDADVAASSPTTPGTDWSTASVDEVNAAVASAGREQPKGEGHQPTLDTPAADILAAADAVQGQPGAPIAEYVIDRDTYNALAALQGKPLVDHDLRVQHDPNAALSSFGTLLRDEALRAREAGAPAPDEGDTVDPGSAELAAMSSEQFLQLVEQGKRDGEPDLYLAGGLSDESFRKAARRLLSND